MEFPEIYIAYIGWVVDGKRRPVLVLSERGDIVKVYPITSQYSRKSRAMQAHFYPIYDLQTAGLKKRSYINTLDITELSRAAVVSVSPIGTLSKRDQKGLLDFLENKGE